MRKRKAHQSIKYGSLELDAKMVPGIRQDVMDSYLTKHHVGSSVVQILRLPNSRSKSPNFLTTLYYIIQTGILQQRRTPIYLMEVMWST